MFADSSQSTHDNIDCLSPAGIVTNGYLFWEQTDLSDPTGDESGTNAFPTNQLGGQMTFSMCKGALAEGAPGGSGWPSPYDTLPPLYENDSADCTVILHTGGKSSVNKQNLFLINGSASQITYPWVNYGVFGGRSTVPPSALQVLGKSLDSNGNLYVVLPDNADIDVTLQAPVPYYFFGVEATQYKCYYTVFVNMPDPDGVNINVGDDFGHAWWLFSTEAPSAAINMFVSPQLSQFIGIQTGYYPSNSIDFFTLIGVYPGLFQLNDTSHTVSTSQATDIGFSDLVRGLQYSKGLSDSPGYWSALTHNCVHAASAAASAAGVLLPYAIFPETLGNELEGKF